MTVHVDKLVYNNHSINATIDLLPITVVLGKPHLNINHAISSIESNHPIVKLFHPSCDKESYNLYCKTTKFENGILVAPDFGHNWYHGDLKDLWDDIYDQVITKNVQFLAHTQSRDVLQSLAYLLKRNNIDTNVSDLALVARIDEQRQKEVTYSHQDIIVCAKHGIEMR